MNWIHKLKPVLNEPNYLQRKLVDEKGWVTLADIRSGVGWNYKENERKYISQLDINTKTLTYLQNLLERGEVTVGRIKRVPKGETASIDVNDHSSVFEDIPGTNEEIIEYIKDNWNNNPDFMEDWDCVLKLPENPWPPTTFISI
jgi:hypothetical protein